MGGEYRMIDSFACLYTYSYCPQKLMMWTLLKFDHFRCVISTAFLRPPISCLCWRNWQRDVTKRWY
jgi:hypothetical protein